MPKDLLERIKIRSQPDFLKEALSFCQEYFKARLAGESYYSTQGFGKEEDSATKEILQQDEAHNLLLTYLRNIRSQMPFLWSGKDDLRDLFIIGKLGDEYGSFINDLFAFFNDADVAEIRRIKKDDFIMAAKLALEGLLQDQMSYMDHDPAELISVYNALRNPDLDLAEIMKKIMSVERGNDEKILLLNFFNDIDSYYERIISSLADTMSACELEYQALEPFYNYKVKSLEDSSELKFLNDEFFSKMEIGNIGFREDEDIYLFISIVEYNGLSFKFSHNLNEKLLIQIGLIFCELIDLDERKEQRRYLDHKQLSALADNTRLQIVRLLSSRPHYAQELADELGITSATLSHHMQILLNSLLISVRTEGRRNYYRLIRSEFLRLSDSLREFSEEGNTNDGS